MPNAQLVERIQAQLRESARQQLDAQAVPPFTSFFNMEDPSPWANYAIPDGPVRTLARGELARLVESFVSRGRQARFEYVEAFAPELGLLLEGDGFVADGHNQLMICTPSTFRPAPAVSGLGVLPLGSTTGLSMVKEMMRVQAEGFGGGDATISSSTAAAFWRRYHRTTFFLAHLHRIPVAAASLLPAHDGLSELAGVATLPAYRRRGIASALISQALVHGFAQGLAGIFLSAADADAGRVYERIGFRPLGTVCTYILP